MRPDRPPLRRATFNLKTGNYVKKRLSPAAFADMMSKSTCKLCGEKGHWARDRSRLNNSNKNNIPDQNRHKSTPHSSPPRRAQSPVPNNKQGTVTFNMVTVSNGYTSNSDSVGPLVEDGAPHSGLGLIEQKSLISKLGVVQCAWQAANTVRRSNKKKNNSNRNNHCRWHALRSVRDSLSPCVGLRPTVAQLQGG